MALVSSMRGWVSALVAVVLAGALVAPGAVEAQQAPVPPLQAPPFVGPAPKPGEIALLLTSRAVTPGELSAGLTTAGCTPVVIAITVGGQWQTFVAGAAVPTFVNAPFAAAFPMIPAATGFFVRCQAAPVPDGLTLAPIESVEVVRSDSATPSYWAVIISGLPSGCAKFERIDAQRFVDAFQMTVWNRTPQTLAPCTAIYGYVTNRVALTGDFIVGRQYSVVVNGQTTTFIAGSTSIRVGGPSAPANVRLTGSLPDTMVLVPAGEAVRGRVTVLWDSAASVTGFRVYQRDCAGVPSGAPIEVVAADRQFGPLQPCRPGGNVGVAAVSAAGESTTTWAR